MPVKSIKIYSACALQRFGGPLASGGRCGAADAAIPSCRQLARQRHDRDEERHE